jgi:hypothetical protein
MLRNLVLGIYAHLILFAKCLARSACQILRGATVSGWLGARYGFKPPKRQNSRLSLDHQLLCLLGFVGSIARALGSVFAVRTCRCVVVNRARGVLLDL